jgi:hypothetical protein
MGFSSTNYIFNGKGYSSGDNVPIEEVWREFSELYAASEKLKNENELLKRCVSAFKKYEGSPWIPPMIERDYWRLLDAAGIPKPGCMCGRSEWCRSCSRLY